MSAQPRSSTRKKTKLGFGAAESVDAMESPMRVKHERKKRRICGRGRGENNVDRRSDPISKKSGWMNFSSPNPGTAP